MKRRVGSIVETPTLFPSFTARRNLELLGRLEGIGPRAVAAMLERVGLGGREDDLVRTYSLGMRQRLGLAAALLKDPALLILDEPSNGLDPAGIKEFRDLIRSLGAEGRTVFVSSHLLGEVQQMCDRVAIIARGRLVTQGSVAEVLSLGHQAKLLVRVPDPGVATAVLAHAGIVASAYDPATDLLLRRPCRGRRCPHHRGARPRGHLPERAAHGVRRSRDGLPRAHRRPRPEHWARPGSRA